MESGFRLHLCVCAYEDEGGALACRKSGRMPPSGGKTSGFCI
jgi:hypothetical protein